MKLGLSSGVVMVGLLVISTVLCYQRLHEDRTLESQNKTARQLLFGSTRAVRRNALVQQPDPVPRGLLDGIAQSVELYQFDRYAPAGKADEYKLYVLASFVEIQDILSTVLRTLSVEASKPAPDNPSWLRYFYQDKEDPTTVAKVFEVIFSMLDWPGYESLRQCGTVPSRKIAIYYDDNADDVTDDVTCRNGNTWAFWGYGGDLSAEGETQEYVKICPRWFEAWRGVRRVPEHMLGVVIDNGCHPEMHTPTWSATLMLLHEMLHFDYYFRNVISHAIEDVDVIRPGGEIHPAYGAFYAMRVKDWNTVDHLSP